MDKSTLGTVCIIVQLKLSFNYLNIICIIKVCIK